MARKDPPPVSAMKYSGLAVQLFLLMLAGWYLGSWIDQYFGLEKPYVGITFTFLFLMGFFYKIYKEVEQGKL